MTAPALPSPFTLVARDSVGSTNDEAVALAAEGARHGTIVWAHEQTAGRGRRGRQWHSPRGNLYASVILRTGRPPAASAQAGFVAAVALRDALADLAPRLLFQCKWPNDILCNGRKIAGLLLESAGEGTVVLGVGVNVSTSPDPALHPATCLLAEGCGAEPAEVLSAFAEELGRWYDIWDRLGFAPVREAWLERAHPVGTPVTVRLGAQGEMRGSFADLDADGALLLDQGDGGRRRVLAGDVFFPAA